LPQRQGGSDFPSGVAAIVVVGSQDPDILVSAELRHLAHVALEGIEGASDREMP
jgi:hypothetical protein